MKFELPNKLSDAEHLLHKSIEKVLQKSSSKLISANLVFNNIRINPMVYRLYKYLKDIEYQCYLVWPDAGGAALAKRDMPDIAKNIFSYSDFIKLINFKENKTLLIAISPQPSDYIEFQKICTSYQGNILMFNGKLEDSAIGIGTIGRERRKEFIYSWKQVFWLQPLTNGAIMKEYNENWILFKLYEQGYKFCTKFENKPDEETINTALQSH
tara:strand:- start:1409 stop:2044 length:636 start_codon:yes stop_codon:yes gene_type:complete